MKKKESVKKFEITRGYGPYKENLSFREQEPGVWALEQVSAWGKVRENPGKLAMTRELLIYWAVRVATMEQGLPRDHPIRRWDMFRTKFPKDNSQMRAELEQYRKEKRIAPREPHTTLSTLTKSVPRLGNLSLNVTESGEYYFSRFVMSYNEAFAFACLVLSDRITAEVTPWYSIPWLELPFNVELVEPTSPVPDQTISELDEVPEVTSRQLVQFLVERVGTDRPTGDVLRQVASIWLSARGFESSEAVALVFGDEPELKGPMAEISERLEMQGSLSAKLNLLREEIEVLLALLQEGKQGRKATLQTRIEKFLQEKRAALSVRQENDSVEQVKARIRTLKGQIAEAMA